MNHRRIGLAVLLIGLTASAWADPRGWLGVYHQELNKGMQAALGVTNGLLLTEIVDESPAAKAGLSLGDVILQIDSEEVVAPDDLSQYVGARPGQSVLVTYLRQGKTDTVTVKLGTRERQLELAFENLPPPRAALQEIRPRIQSWVQDYRDELRALRDEIKLLQKEIARLRKDLKKVEK